MGARLLWEQEDLGSTRGARLDEMVVEGWSPYPSDKRIALSSILRATTAAKPQSSRQEKVESREDADVYCGLLSTHYFQNEMENSYASTTNFDHRLPATSYSLETHSHNHL